MESFDQGKFLNGEFLILLGDLGFLFLKVIFADIVPFLSIVIVSLLRLFLFLIGFPVLEDKCVFVMFIFFHP